MYRPLSVCVGLRYTRAKKKNHFISFIAFLSMIGIALGVLVLITILSVMNGFDHQIKSKVFSMVPDITITDLTGEMPRWQQVEDKLKKIPQVTSVEPVVSGEGMLQAYGNTSPAYIYGIRPSYGKTTVQLADDMVLGSLEDLDAVPYSVVLGQNLAYSLGVTLDDSVILITPNIGVSPVGITPRLKRFKVVGIFHANSGFNYDDSVAFVDLHGAQALFQHKNAVTALDIKINDPFSVAMVTQTVRSQLENHYVVSNWTGQYGNFFHAIEMEKTMMFFILMLIIAVAIFNLVSMLVMAANEKRGSIAIMRTYGASRGLIMRIFIVQGFMIGLLGTFFGVIGGVILSHYATQIVEAAQQYFNTQFITADVYFIDFLPSELQYMDVVHVAAVALSLSFLATIYPAWRATKVNPAQVLRNE